VLVINGRSGIEDVRFDGFDGFELMNVFPACWYAGRNNLLFLMSRAHNCEVENELENTVQMIMRWTTV